VGAKLVPEIMENVTPPEQFELLEMTKINGFVGRARGTGRPTKKDRRSMDEFMMPSFGDFSDILDDGADDEEDDDEFDFSNI
jgi:ribosome-associated heat shock protein Hsp15